jgi:NAD(P)H-hydrate epimerase
MGLSFITDTGIVVPALTATQMREVDRVAVEETGPNIFQMMENAGRSLALCSIEMLGTGWHDARVVVLAGPGGNGGGGICAARHLANRGARVRLCVADEERLGDVPVFQRRIYCSTSGGEIPFAQLDEEPADLVLDAIIGYSLLGAPHGTALHLIRWANLSDAPVLSLDVPSGVDATTGQTPGEFVEAHRTMTLALPKTGLIPSRTGELFLADIGIPEAVYRRVGLRYQSPFDSRFRVPLSIRPT